MLRYNLGFVVNSLYAMQGSFGCAPDIRPDLTGLRRDKLPIVVLALLNAGLTDVLGVDAYLQDHGSPFEFEELLLAIEDHHTTARDADGKPDGLWDALPDGSLKPNLSVTH